MYGLKPVPFSKDGWTALLRKDDAPLAGLVQERKTPTQAKTGLEWGTSKLTETQGRD